MIGWIDRITKEYRNITIIWIIRRQLGLEPPYFDRFGGEENAKRILGDLLSELWKCEHKEY